MLVLVALAFALNADARPDEHGAAFEPHKQKSEKKSRAQTPTREERRAERKKKAEARQLAAQEKKVAREIARKERLIAARGYGNIHLGAAKKPEKPSLLTQLVGSAAWAALDVADYVRANPSEIEYYISFKICGIPIYERRLNPPLEAPKPQPSVLYPRLTEIPKFREE